MISTQFRLYFPNTFWKPCHSMLKNWSCWPSIKNVRIFLVIFLYPPPPCRHFNHDFPNPYLLISCNIKIWDHPSPLKYSDIMDDPLPAFWINYSTMRQGKTQNFSICIKSFTFNIYFNTMCLAWHWTMTLLFWGT